jgi:hypothetical protein
MKKLFGLCRNNCPGKAIGCDEIDDAPWIRVFKKFSKLKIKPYWGNHFWAPGYCVDMVGLDEEKIRRYVQYEELKEKHKQQGKLFK